MFRAFLLFALLWLSPAVAQAAPCAKRADFLQHLSSKFDEVPVAMGLTSDGKVLEILASGNGSWTIIVTMPTGLTCALTAGGAWSKAPTRAKQPSKPRS